METEKETKRDSLNKKEWSKPEFISQLDINLTEAGYVSAGGDAGSWAS